jgi:hypothetical protein
MEHKWSKVYLSDLDSYLDRNVNAGWTIVTINGPWDTLSVWVVLQRERRSDRPTVTGGPGL